MIKSLYFICALVAVMLVGCSFKKDLPIKQSHDTPSVLTQGEIPLLKAIDATNLLNIKPYDENTIYIIAAKKREDFANRELVYAICLLNTGEISSVHREIISSDESENADVYLTPDQKIKFFTGRQVLTLENGKVVNIDNIIDTERSVNVNLKTDIMSYLNKEPPSIFYKFLDENDEHELVKAKEIEIDGEKVILFPYIARLNKDGDKVLYGTAVETALFYQTVAICSTDGTILAETDQLNIIADYLDMLWFGDGFVTIETTDSYMESPTGLATILTKYNKNAEEIGKTVLHGIVSNYQREFFPGMSLFALSYQTESTNGLVLWDAETGNVYYVCDEEDYILSPTITPEGRKLLWFSNGSIHIENIDLKKYEKIPTY